MKFIVIAGRLVEGRDPFLNLLGGSLFVRESESIETLSHQLALAGCNEDLVVAAYPVHLVTADWMQAARVTAERQKVEDRERAELARLYAIYGMPPSGSPEPRGKDGWPLWVKEPIR